MPATRNLKNGSKRWRRRLVSKNEGYFLSNFNVFSAVRTLKGRLVCLKRNNAFVFAKGDVKMIKNIFLSQQVDIRTQLRGKSNGGFNPNFADANQQLMMKNRDITSITNQGIYPR